jgi:hypothetical protein
MKIARGKTATSGMYAWTARQRAMRRKARRAIKRGKGSKDYRIILN